VDPAHAIRVARHPRGRDRVRPIEKGVGVTTPITDTAATPATTAPPRLDGSLAAALFGNFLVRLDSGMVGAMITLFLGSLKERGIMEVTAMTVGLVTAVFYLIEVTFSPLMGAKSDQHGNRTLLLVGPLFGILAVCAASVAALITEVFWQQIAYSGAIVLGAIAVTRMLQGFSAAASIPSILSYLAVRTEGSLSLRGRVMSIFEVTSAIGIVGGPALGAFLWQRFHAWGFLLTGVVFVSSAIFFLIVREDRGVVYHTDRQGLDDPFWTRLRRVLRRRELLVFVPAWLSVNAIIGLWGIHLVFQMRAGSATDGQFLSGSFSGDTISAVLAGYGLCFCVGILLWGGLVLGRLREVTVMRLSLTGLFVLCAAVYGINHLGGEPASLWGLVAVATIGLLIQAGFAPAAVTYLARLAAMSEQDRGLVMGVYAVVLGLGQVVGVVLGGRFADISGVDGIILFTLLLGIAGAVTVLKLEPNPDGATGPVAHHAAGLPH
jgi:MFS family permease